jgi:hypothetical protein
MLRQERFGGGPADQKDMDSELARQIMTDGGFKVGDFNVYHLLLSEALSLPLRTTLTTLMTTLKS